MCSRTTISIRKKLDGMQVYRFCPGLDYVVKVQFPEPRSLKLAAAQGIWEALTGNWCAGMALLRSLRSPAQQLSTDRMLLVWKHCHGGAP